MELKKIRITSDGSVDGTKIYDVDTGEQLNNVQSVTWSIDARDVKDLAPLARRARFRSTVTMTFKGVVTEVDVLGTLEDAVEAKGEG